MIRRPIRRRTMLDDDHQIAPRRSFIRLLVSFRCFPRCPSLLIPFPPPPPLPPLPPLPPRCPPPLPTADRQTQLRLRLRGSDLWPPSGDNLSTRLAANWACGRQTSIEAKEEEEKSATDP